MSSVPAGEASGAADGAEPMLGGGSILVGGGEQKVVSGVEHGVLAGNEDSAVAVNEGDDSIAGEAEF